FFIKAKTGPASVTFNESAKSIGARQVFFTSGAEQTLRASLHIINTVPVLVDGIMVNFDSTYDNAINDEDGPKFTNNSENVSLKSQDKLLSVERRHTVITTDTLHLNLAGTKIQQYQWQIRLENMDEPSLIAYLVDQYKNTTTQIDLMNGLDYDFS